MEAGRVHLFLIPAWTDRSQCVSPGQRGFCFLSTLNCSNVACSSTRGLRWLSPRSVSPEQERRQLVKNWAKLSHWRLFFSPLHSENTLTSIDYLFFHWRRCSDAKPMSWVAALCDGVTPRGCAPSSHFAHLFDVNSCINDDEHVHQLALSSGPLYYRANVQCSCWTRIFDEGVFIFWNTIKPLKRKQQHGKEVQVC